MALPGGRPVVAAATRGTGANAAVDVALPVLWAFLMLDAPARPMVASRQVFRAGIRVHIDSQDSQGAGVQAYVLPSQGDSAVGIRLPSAGNVHFMFTTTQDGCTFQAGGPANSPFVSHTNHFWSVSNQTHNDLTNPGHIAQALVIGERAGPGQPWNFYYQESTNVHLVRKTVYKVGGLKLKTVEHDVGGRVILSYGRLWPAPQTATFLPMD